MYRTQWSSDHRNSPPVTKPLLFPKIRVVIAVVEENYPSHLLHIYCWNLNWNTFFLHLNKMVSVSVLVKHSPWGRMCNLQGCARKAEGHTASLPPPTPFPIWLPVHIGSNGERPGFISAWLFKVFQRWANTKDCTPISIQSTIWSYIKMISLLLVLYEWNK